MFTGNLAFPDKNLSLSLSLFINLFLHDFTLFDIDTCMHVCICFLHLRWFLLRPCHNRDLINWFLSIYENLHSETKQFCLNVLHTGTISLQPDPYPDPLISFFPVFLYPHFPIFPCFLFSHVSYFPMFHIFPYSLFSHIPYFPIPYLSMFPFT